MEIESQQLVHDVLNDLAPPEAIVMLPHVRQQYAERVKASEQAQSDVARRKATCDENDEVLKFTASLRAKKTAELSDLTGTQRPELYSLRESFALEEQAARKRRLMDAVSYLDAEYDHLLCVKRGADEILFLDGLEVLALAKSLVAHSAALCSHVETVAALGTAYEGEGSLGVIGARTMRLQAEAVLADKRYESAKDAARESRMAYERQQSARVSRGLVISANVTHAIG